MIPNQQFFFVRHGQTDHNALEGADKGDHPHDIPLNEVGRTQAQKIEPVVASLAVKTVCVSPMKRAIETKEIVTARVNAPHHEIENLGECSSETWNELRTLGMYARLPKEGKARKFMDRVREGLNEALQLPGPVLIIAHGGVHWALCCLLEINEHSWAIDNCGVVEFKKEEKWIAKQIK